MLDFRRYLEAKRSVDDRALNQRVLRRLLEELETRTEPSIVDIGAGIGTGLERLLDGGLVAPADYTAVDESEALVETARQRLGARVAGRFVTASLQDFAAGVSHRERFDLVVAHAFLDLVDLEPSLESLVALARPGGLLYFPITFDGESIFEPADAEDERILAAYHSTIPGDGRAGRRLYHALAQEPVEILAMGSSDWIIHSREPGGRYPDEDAFFLHCILSMIEDAVGEAAARWVDLRRRQVGDGDLLYIAHQVDCLARRRV